MRHRGSCFCAGDGRASGRGRPVFSAGRRFLGAVRIPRQNPLCSQSIIDSTSQTAIDNITGAEQVFCYQVQGKPSGYSGYTLDGMALTGFCGIVEKDLKDMIVQQFLATPENISADVERCVIQPRLLSALSKGVERDRRSAVFSVPFLFNILRRKSPDLQL